MHILNSIWLLSPLMVALFVLLIDFCFGIFLMVLEGLMPWKRNLCKAFVLGDTIFIPIYFYTVSQEMHNNNLFPGIDVINPNILAIGIILSIAIEFYRVKSGQYTTSQEFSPSKIWHTFIFVPIFYWVITSFIVILQIDLSTYSVILIFVGILGFVFTLMLDEYSQKFSNSHLEGTYIPWRWHVRRF